MATKHTQFGRNGGVVRLGLGLGVQSLLPSPPARPEPFSTFRRSLVIRSYRPRGEASATAARLTRRTVRLTTALPAVIGPHPARQYGKSTDMAIHFTPLSTR